MTAHPMVYRIVRWNDTFENAGSRQVNDLSWFSQPNRHDGAGYRRLIGRKDGMQLYAAWELTVQTVSRLGKRLRGYIVNEQGHPLDAEDLAARTGGRVQVFARMFEVLAEARIGWIEAVSADVLAPLLAASSTLPDASSTLPAGSAYSKGQDSKGEESKGQESKGPDPIGEKSKKPDPIGEKIKKPDPTRDGPDRGLHEDSIGSGRNGNANGNGRADLCKFRNLFALKVATALGPGCGGLAKQRRPMIALAKRFENRPDRDECQAQCIALAQEKAGASLDNPAAAFQAAVDELWPKPCEGMIGNIVNQFVPESMARRIGA